MTLKHPKLKVIPDTYVGVIQGYVHQNPVQCKGQNMFNT
jgi:hypothetical protein